MIIVLALDEKWRARRIGGGTGFGGTLELEDQALDQQHEDVVELAGLLIAAYSHQMDVPIRGVVPLRDFSRIGRTTMGVHLLQHAIGIGDVALLDFFQQRQPV
jgi:hypothetical protein